MAYGIALKVWGDYACFTRPEMKAERMSYDVITPSAARGIVEAVYWKPDIRWVIDRLHVINPIRFTNIRRNELGGKVPAGNVKKAMRDNSYRLEHFVEDDRQQRAANILVDVCYVIEAHFEFREGAEPNEGKHLDQFNRRARRGQCYHRPYLGCREFDAHFDLVEEIPESAVRGERFLGWMLHDIDFENGMQPRFFRASMKDGMIEVPELRSEEVHG